MTGGNPSVSVDTQKMCDGSFASTHGGTSQRSYSPTNYLHQFLHTARCAPPTRSPDALLGSSFSARRFRLVVFGSSFSARLFRLALFGSLFSARSFRLALPAVTPLLQEARDRPHQRGERELLPRHPLRLLVRELTLAFAEEGGADPGAGAGVSPPVGVE